MQLSIDSQDKSNENDILKINIEASLNEAEISLTMRRE